MFTSEMDCPTSGMEDIPRLGIPTGKGHSGLSHWPRGHLGARSGDLSGSSLSLARTIGCLLVRVTPGYLSPVMGPSVPRCKTPCSCFVKGTEAPGGLRSRTGM